MKTEKTTETIQEFLDALENPKKNLTFWESNFVTSVSDQFAHTGSLSDKQFEVLENIYTEKT